MKKSILKSVLFSIFLLYSGVKPSIAENILVADLVTYDSQGQYIDITKELKNSYFGVLEKFQYDNDVAFRKISKYGSILSIADASKVSKAEDCRYLIYGYVQKNDSCWFSNLKLFDKQNNMVTEEFFGAENFDNLDKLLELQAYKIDEKIKVLYGQSDKAEFKEIIPSSLLYEFNSFYWSPVNQQWAKRLLGTGGIDIGVEFFPAGSGFVFKNKKIIFGGKIAGEYKYGFGRPDYYNADWHSFVLKHPVVSKFEIDCNKSVYFGLGPYYEFNLLLIDKKYETTSSHIQNQCGVDIESGLLLYLKNDISLNTGIEMNIPITKKSFIAVKPKIGVVWKSSKDSRSNRQIENKENNFKDESEVLHE